MPSIPKATDNEEDTPVVNDLADRLDATVSHILNVYGLNEEQRNTLEEACVVVRANTVVKVK